MSENWESKWQVVTVGGTTYIGSIDYMRYYVWRGGETVTRTGRDLIRGVTDPWIWDAFWLAHGGNVEEEISDLEFEYPACSVCHDVKYMNCDSDSFTCEKCNCSWALDGRDGRRHDQ